MDEMKRSLDYFISKSESITQSFALAINGAFFSIRSAGHTPSPSQIENAKLDVSKARYVYVDGINHLMDEIVAMAAESQINVNAAKIDLATMQLISISTEMTHQANRALTHGVSNKAAKLLSKTATGAMGLLVQRKLMKVELNAHDVHGRKWSEPTDAVYSVMRRLIDETF